MKKPKTKGDQTRAQILEGAVRSLMRTGVVGTTTRKIALEAGVQLATLHYHFDNKSALLVAVLDSLVEDMAVRYRAMLDASLPDIDAAIAHLMRTVWDSVQESRAVQIIHYELTLYALREGAEWIAVKQYDAFLAIYREWLMAVPEEVRRLSAEDCTVLARFLLAGVDGLILQELALPDEARSRRGIEALVTAGQAYARALAEGAG